MVVVISESIPELKKLSPKEKLILATELWEDYCESDGEAVVDEAVFRVLEERFAGYEDDPSSAVTWDDFKKRLGKS